MFSKLEEDTKKQREKSKNGTKFYADYYADYIKEEYTDNKGKKKYHKKYIGDYYILEKSEKKKLILSFIILLMSFIGCFYAGVQYVEFNYIWYINLFQIAFLFITVYLMVCNVQGFLLSEQNTRKEFMTSVGNLRNYLPYTTIMLGIIVLLCLVNIVLKNLFEVKNIINIVYYLISLCLNYLAYKVAKNIKYDIKKRDK